MRTVVAAMARSALSMVWWLGSHLRPRAPASSAMSASTGCQTRVDSNAVGVILFCRAHASEDLDAGDFTRMKDVSGSLSFEEVAGTCMPSQVVDQYRGVYQGAHERLRSRREPERSRSTQAAPSRSWSFQEPKAWRIALRSSSAERSEP